VPNREGRSPGRVINHGSRADRRVALTFDSNMTHWMREQLMARRVRSYCNNAIINWLYASRTPATLFLTGLWVDYYREQTESLSQLANVELGSHGYSNRAFTAGCRGLGYLSVSEMAPDISRSFETLVNVASADRVTRLFRFPGLCFDKTSLSVALHSNVLPIGADVESGDAFEVEPSPIVKGTLSRLRNGSIVVLHLTEENAPVTHIAAPIIASEIERAGLRLCKVSELIRIPPCLVES
jgi:peptidoglycan-N-acetylglucosamine deacetylase